MRRGLFWVMAVALLAGWGASAQTAAQTLRRAQSSLRAEAAGRTGTSLRVGDVTSPAGYETFVPLELSSVSVLCAVNVRLRYDPQVLEFLGVNAGPLVPAGFLLDVSEPERGAVNVLICPANGTTALAGQAGTLAALRFRVSSDAAAGTETPVTFASDCADPFAFPACSLSTTSGVQASHSRTGGVVRVLRAYSVYPHWMLY